MPIFLKDKFCVLILGSCYLLASIIFEATFREISTALSLALMGAIILMINLETYRRLQKQISEQYQDYKKNEYRQIESLFSIFSLIKINHPLPSMRGYAAAPDFASTLISLIKEQKPKLILEVGSGVSTLIAAYCLQSIGEGTVISLDHEKTFANLSSKNLFKHELQDFATVIHAPLSEISLKENTWLWYETSELFEAIKNQSIDLLILDGPPWNTQKLARYPALPILFDFLSKNAIIVIDDAARKDEKEILNLWMKEFNCFQLELLDSDSGTAILSRTSI
jgi:predicted O-methyltransferase YrrM